MMPVRKNNGQGWLPNFFNDFFDNNWVVKANTTAPAINVVETAKDYQVDVAAPGMNKEDFKIEINKENDLVITMEKKCNCTDCSEDEKEKKEEKEGRYLRREFSYTKFRQTLILPDDVNREHIHAQVKDGVLTIELPKIVPESKPETTRAIEIE